MTKLEEGEGQISETQARIEAEDRMKMLEHHIETNRVPVWCMACGAEVQVYSPPGSGFAEDTCLKARHTCGGKLSVFKFRLSLEGE